MLKVQEIRELIKLVDQSSLDEFVYEHEGYKIKMKKNLGERMVVTQPTTSTAAVMESVQKQALNSAPANQPVVLQAPNSAPAKENLHKITSPMVGTFYQSPSPDADDYVKVGSKVLKDSIVCIVEAMKLFNEIEAEVNGEIVEFLVKDGQLVEYGQPLFLVKPE